MIERGAEPDVLALVSIQPAAARWKLRHEKSTKLIAFRSRRLGAGRCIPANTGACKLVFFVPQNVIKCAHFGMARSYRQSRFQGARWGGQTWVRCTDHERLFSPPGALLRTSSKRGGPYGRGLPIAGRSMTGLSSRPGRRGSEGIARSLRDAVMANALLRHRSANRSNLSGSHQANVGERVRGAGCVRISPTD